MFLLTSMPIGGAETLLVNLVRQIDRERIEPFVACLKDRDVLGDVLANEIPVFDRLIHHKYDFAVAGRLKSLFIENQIDAVITIGAGDKMFWGRLAAKRARVPVILSALHSTGWPDGVGRLNRMLTGITDGFIAVAKQHARYQIETEKFPKEKVFLIPNGIDTDHFIFDDAKRHEWRSRIGIEPNAPVVGIVAALRSEKNHALFLESAHRVIKEQPTARFVIAGDGPERSRLESICEQNGMQKMVHFLGSVNDIQGVLSMMDLFALSSDNEASPVSIMEALSCQRPVVATDVGSVDETVLEGQTGFLVPTNDAESMSQRWLQILTDSDLAKRLGASGRKHIISTCSLDVMTEGYMSLVEKIFHQNSNRNSATDPIGTPTTPTDLVSWQVDMPNGNGVD